MNILLSLKNNPGSARIPAPSPATVHSCAHHHPPHNRFHVVQLAIHEEVCFRAQDEAPFSDLSIHCSHIAPDYIHSESYICLPPL